FYVKVDTAAPGIVNNVALALQEIWRNADPGAIYGALLSDEASGVDTLQYSASRNAGTADQGVASWTTVAANLNALSAAPGFALNFAGLADGASNYISLRVWDVAGSTRILVDAFKVWKDTTGPAVAVTVPAPGGFRSALTSVSGTAADGVSLRGSEISIWDATNGSYWDDATAGFNSASPVFYPVQGDLTWSSGSIAIGWINGNSYSIIARSSDAAGNYSALYATATFTFDMIMPTAGIVAPANGSSVSNLAAISGTAADPNVGPGPGPAAGVASVQLRFQRLSDGLWWNFFSESWSAVQVSSAAGGTNSWVHSPSALLQANLASNASYFITAAAGDFAEPPNQASFFAVGTTFTFVDNTPPAAVGDLSATPTTTPGELVVQWSAPGDDGNSGIILLGQYAIGHATFSAAGFSTATAQVVFSTAVVVPGTPHSRLLTNSAGLSPGTTYFLAVFTRDDAGNWSAVSNVASARTAFTPPNSITGHVVNLSTQGITGVLMNAYNPDGSLASTTYTLNDGSGTYALAGLSSGAYIVEAVWTANGLTSSIWKDGIAMGSFNVDFVLTVSYTLASITGQMFALESDGEASGGAAYRARAAARSSANGYVELFQNGRRIAVSGVNADGRFTVSNLLPGRYSLRGYNGLAFTPLIDVSLLEGEVREVSLVWDPLPEPSVYAFPNPARDRTTLRFETNVAGPEAQILVFDVTGALVREIPGSEMTSPQLGLYHANWDLTNQRGEAVVSGIYLFLVKVRSSTTGQVAHVTKKLAIVR
ncbi:MAG: hypothetical protein HY551_01780, partial [Elusimicrobia bacterium]|nr:hypothetical protein [Elusimicrobiota bacterium]